MSTLYTRNGEGVFELPGRTVNTFTSGLVRVDTSYAIKTSNIAAARSVDFQVGSEIVGDSYPAVDGLYLYPEPQEVRREYGMTELMASYYGRTRTDVPPPTVIEKETYGYDTAFLLGSQNGFIVDTTNLRISLNDLFFQFVVPVGEIINFRDKDLFDSPLTEPNAVYYDDGTGPEPITFTKSSVVNNYYDYYNYPNIGQSLDGYFSKQFRLFKPQIKVVAQRNFGNFVELDVTFNRYIGVGYTQVNG